MEAFNLDKTVWGDDAWEYKYVFFCFSEESLQLPY
jgi:hypothetical protein